MKLLLVHGYGGDGENHFFPWMVHELAGVLPVVAPTLPTPEVPQADAWVGAIAEHLTSGDLVVGHSLGVVASLLALQARPDVTLAGFVSLAGFVRRLGHLPFADALQSFIDPRLDLRALRKQARDWQVWESDTDPYVPLAEGAHLTDELGATRRVFPHRDHLGTWQTPPRFDELLGWVKAHLAQTL